MTKVKCTSWVPYIKSLYLPYLCKTTLKTESSDMGCCACRPLDLVEQDPSVSFYTNVGDIVFIRPLLTSRIVGCCDGIMYVKDGTLYYETKCSGRLCCLCARQGVKLADIRSVVLVKNDTFRYQGPMRLRPYPHRTTHQIRLSPGLRITTSNNTMIAVATPDAAVFSQQLHEVVPALK